MEILSYFSFEETKILFVIVCEFLFFSFASLDNPQSWTHLILFWFTYTQLFTTEIRDKFVA